MLGSAIVYSSCTMDCILFFDIIILYRCSRLFFTFIDLLFIYDIFEPSEFMYVIFYISIIWFTSRHIT